MENSQAPRLQSADVYRGFVMFLMMAEVLQFSAVSASLPSSGFWRFLGFHQSHVDWLGCSLHDLIQPSFTFLVGLVLPLSLGNRKNKHESFLNMLLHSVWRAMILVFLGIFLRSIHSNITYFTFEDTLTQIGLGYVFLFLLGFCKWRVQLLVFILLLISYWLFFALHPLPSSDLNLESIGVDPNWKHNLSGFAAHWNINANPAWVFDRWFLNLFPRESKFVGSAGGYVTLSFIPTLATMVFGLLVSNVLLSLKSATYKLKTILVIGLIGLSLGLILEFIGICPIVKRIWTPSWVLFSGGWCCIMLAFFYFIIDIKQRTNWALIFKIIGMNSIAAYVIAHTVDRFIASSFNIHFGSSFFDIFGNVYHHLFLGFCVLSTEVLILFYMFHKKIFIRI